jgi:hypothetical protein
MQLQDQRSHKNPAAKIASSQQSGTVSVGSSVDDTTTRPNTTNNGNSDALQPTLARLMSKVRPQVNDYALSLILYQVGTIPLTKWE